MTAFTELINMKLIARHDCEWRDIITHGLLAVENVEVIVHAGSQQQMLLGWMPLQTPHPSSQSTFAERPPHVAPIPQQDVLVVAGDTHMVVRYKGMYKE